MKCDHEEADISIILHLKNAMRDPSMKVAIIQCNDTDVLPCINALRQHAARAAYQIGIQRRSLMVNMYAPSPTQYGWSTEGGTLVLGIAHQDVDRITEPAIASCYCKSTVPCSTSTCRYVKAGVSCTDACHLGVSFNNVVDEEEESDSNLD